MRLVENVTNRPDGVIVMQDDVPIGRATRLLISIGGAFHPLIFLSFRKDGSVVCGPGHRAPILERTARRRETRDRPLPPKLQADIGTAATPPDFHISFHASGVVNSPGSARTYRAPLNSPGPQQLCRFDFEHPSRASAVTARKRDIVLPGEFRLTSALRGLLTVIPRGTVAFFGDEAEQAVFIFNVRHPDGEMAYRLQFSVFGTGEPWPDATNIEWVSQDPHVHGFSG